MEREVKNIAASVRARLMNIARAEKIDFDFLLLRYFQERFLYRLAISEFSDRFILKGGLLLICLKMPMSRPTKDIDFLAHLRRRQKTMPLNLSIFLEVLLLYLAMMVLSLFLHL